MRRLLISIIIFLTTLPVFSQAPKKPEEKRFFVNVYGFVRNDFYYDSRRSIESAAGLFHLIPEDRKLNDLNEDLNEIPSSKLLSTASRFGLRVKGPNVWGASAAARIEADFDGFSGSNTMFRIRQAWVKLMWDQIDLAVGQSWHPMFGEVVPTVMSLATGSPFQPFNRSPQVRVDYRAGDFKTYLAALYKLQYNSPGPFKTSSDYLRDGILPELYLGFDFTKKRWMAGAGIDFIRLRPRVIGEREIQINGEPRVIETKVSDNISSFSFNAFAQYMIKDRFAIKAKTIYGQNMGHLLLLNGYGISKKNDNGSYEYTGLSNSTSWLNITYGGKYQAGLFLGYSKNLGSSNKLLEEPYTFGPSNIDQVFRVAPQVSYNLRHWLFGIEYEMTTASYGTMDLRDGKVKNTHNVTNNRIVGTMAYYF